MRVIALMASAMPLSIRANGDASGSEVDITYGIGSSAGYETTSGRCSTAVGGIALPPSDLTGAASQVAGKTDSVVDSSLSGAKPITNDSTLRSCATAGGVPGAEEAVGEIAGAPGAVRPVTGAAAEQVSGIRKIASRSNELPSGAAAGDLGAAGGGGSVPIPDA